MTPAEFLTRANQRFADNEFQNITERSFREAAQDQADTFVAQGPPNIPFYKEGTTYRVDDVVQFTYGPTQIFAAVKEGKLPAPATPQGDANWRLTVPIVAEIAFAQVLFVYQAQELARARKFKVGRLYILGWRVDNTGAPLYDVRVRALTESELEPQGYEMRGVGQQVQMRYDLASDTTSEIQAGGITAAQLEAVRTTVKQSSAITGNYMLRLADAGNLIRVTAAAQITVPAASAVAFALGTVIELVPLVASGVSIAAGSGVTILATTGVNAAGMGAPLRLVLLAVNYWLLTGGA